MFTPKSSQINYHPTSKTLIFELSPDKEFNSNSTGLFPHRIKKLRHPDSQRKNKIIRMIQDIAQLNPFTSPNPRTELINKHFLQRTGNISSYLLYKKEQQNLKMQHYMKVSYLKNRCHERRLSSQKQSYKIVSRSHTLSPNHIKKGSMSKINLELEEPQTIKKSQTSPAKSRQFYLKTSQGKRQRMSSEDYDNKIKNRLNNSDNKDVLSKFNQFSQNQFFMQVSQPQMMPKPTTSSQMTRNMKYNKNKSNSILRLRQSTRIECRPWTSSRSDYEC